MEEEILVAVGSTRRPKLDGTREALALVGPLLAANARFDIVGVEVPSGVRHTPLSREDTMTGARQRAEALVQIARQTNKLWKYFVGLEGGIDVVVSGSERCVLLQNWAYVTDGSGQGAFGQSGAVMLPKALAKRVVEDGIELSEAIDAFAGSHGIRDGEGAWGILTGGLITRRDAFRVAVINAFAPFMSHSLRARPERGGT
jgi:inosine/xanthosine triphosphatase